MGVHTVENQLNFRSWIQAVKIMDVHSHGYNQAADFIGAVIQRNHMSGQTMVMVSHGLSTVKVNI